MRFVKTSLLVIWFIGLTLVLLEIGARTALYLDLVPAKSMRVVNALTDNNGVSYSTGDFTNGDPIALIAPRAYYLYINAPLSGTKAGTQITPEGYRNGKEAIRPSFDGIRILAIGGSTTYGWMLEDYRDAWPARLEAILKKKLPYPVQVINAGLPAGTTPELLVAYALRDQFFRPDIVIIHNGGNDAHPLFFADYRPDYSTYRTTMHAGVKVRPGERYLLVHSALIKLIYAAWLGHESLGAVQTQPEHSPTVKEAMENVKKNAPVGFERNMKTLISLIRANGGQPVLFPFYLAEKEVFTLVPEPMRYSETTYDPLQMGIAKNLTVQHRFAEEERVPLFEMPPKSIPLADFFDHCHLKPEGEEMKAEFLASKLMPVIAEKARNKGLAD